MPFTYSSLGSAFWTNTKVVEVGCWAWAGSLSKKGYGRLRYRSKNWLAHRVSWFLHYGAIPEDMLVCHKCDNPTCVKPTHLFLGSYLDNNRDRASKGRCASTKKTHCPAGHLYEGDNLYNSPTGRRCRTCKEALTAELHSNYLDGLRSPNYQKTHCPQGHEYTPENTRINPKSFGRTCRQCERVRSLARYYRMKDK